jgi:hypothetical protein
MRAKLLALSIGLAVLCGGGIACADTVVSPGTQVKAAPQMPAGTKTAPGGEVRRPLVLTETQMDKITAGLGGHGGGNTGLSLLGGPGNPHGL